MEICQTGHSSARARIGTYRMTGSHRASTVLAPPPAPPSTHRFQRIQVIDDRGVRKRQWHIQSPNGLAVSFVGKADAAQLGAHKESPRVRANTELTGWNPATFPGLRQERRANVVAFRFAKAHAAAFGGNSEYRFLGRPRVRSSFANGWLSPLSGFRLPAKKLARNCCWCHRFPCPTVTNRQ